MQLLILARAWYFVVGGGAVLLTVGNVMGRGPGSGSTLLDVMIPIGIAFGVLSIAAAMLVSATDPLRVAISWLGIVAGTLPFLALLWIAITTAQDAIVLASIPTVIAVAAAATLARDRMRAQRGKY